jgi:hypothetical protein
VADRADGARCQEFNAYFFGGRGQRLVGPLTTLDEAAAQALEWERLYGPTTGRRAALYGRKPEGGSVFIYEDMWRPEESRG